MSLYLQEIALNRWVVGHMAGEVFTNVMYRLWTEEEWTSQTSAVLDLGTTDTEVHVCHTALLHAM